MMCNMYLLRLLFAGWLLYVNTSEVNIDCFISPREDGSTHYSVKEFNSSGCIEKWMDKDRHNLQTIVTKDNGSEVMYPSNRNFSEDLCKETVIFLRECTSRGIHLEAICINKCFGAANLQEQPSEGGKPSNGADDLTGTPRSLWWALLPVVLVVLLI